MSRTPPRAIVVAGGAVGDLPSEPSPSSIVIAADSGLDACLASGLAVDVVVGDLDSVSAESLVAARRDGVEIIEHPGAKDRTDLELAVGVAIDRGGGAIEVHGIEGGRIDHLLGNVAALVAAAQVGADVTAWFGRARLVVVARSAVLQGIPGDLVSLLAYGGPAGPITTTGLEYPLDGEVLSPYEARGVSNVLQTSRATIASESGWLLVVHQPPEPHAHQRP